MLPGAFTFSGSSYAGQLIWPELWQDVIEKMSMAARMIACNFFISITIHIHHGTDEERQISLTVDEHIDERPIQHDFLKFYDLHGPFCYHFHCGGCTGPGALLSNGNKGLMEDPVNADVHAIYIVGTQFGEVRDAIIEYFKIIYS